MTNLLIKLGLLMELSDQQQQVTAGGQCNCNNNGLFGSFPSNGLFGDGLLNNSLGNQGQGSSSGSGSGPFQQNPYPDYCTVDQDGDPDSGNWTKTVRCSQERSS